jgi:hypothetical protein
LHTIDKHLIYYLGQQSEDSIRLTRDALNSHICGTRRSSDGNYYLFVVQLKRKSFDQDLICLLNKDAYLALPTHLIVYKRRSDFH